MPLKIIHNDITEMDSDAIVNPANCNLKASGGVCGAIFKKAGHQKMQAVCDKLAPIATGSAIITPGFNLKAKYVIHTVGPVYQDGKHHEQDLLIKAYTNSLKLAVSHHLKSISFPLISSGIYGYPKQAALQVAVNTITNFLKEYDLDVNIVVFDRSAVKISEQLYQDIEHYLDTYFVETRYRRNIELLQATPHKSFFEEDNYDFLDDLIDQRQETFSTMLLRLIDEKGYSDVEVYKRANIDRKLFSKIRKQSDYHPKKNTVFSFAIALKLDVDETIDLLDSAGYSLSNSQKNDIIIRYFIEHQEYDIFKINEALFCFEQPLLAT